MNGENHDEKSEIKKGGSHHAARKITIPDAPSITPLDWISQVLESINAQVLTVDIGLVSASQGEASSVRCTWLARIIYLQHSIFINISLK